MRGIAGDAVIIAIGIIIFALVFYRYWYPPLRRWFLDIKDDVDKFSD
jgi:hypothetical protein